MNYKLMFAAVAVFVTCVAAQADVFSLGPGLTNLEMAAVGDAGNAADTRHNNISVGSVSYDYNIGKYEVTAAQYVDFLNHKAKTDPYGLYNSLMADTSSYFDGCNIQRDGSDGNYTYTVGRGIQSDLANWGNRPVNYISYWDACRFTNWLSNGQGDGNTETGAYTLDGYMGTDGRTIQRNANWTWAVTSEDEWYKAAYYKGGGPDVGYWLYPTQSDSIITSMANYELLSVGHPTDVGTYAYSSVYGTYDQGGNVLEWTEAWWYGDSSVHRIVRGGYYSNDASVLESPMRYIGDGIATNEYAVLGFRVSQVVPEPYSVVTLFVGIGGFGMVGFKKKRSQSC